MSRDPSHRSARHSAPRPGMGAATQPTTRSVFLVEDSPEDREVSRRYLMADPDVAYVLLQYGTGQKALSALATERPDCILLDFQLPDMDGLAFLTRMREASGCDQSCAVVMLTGSGGESVAVRTLKAGAQDYLIKDTLTPEALRHAVRSAIEKVALERALEEQRRALALSEQRFRGIVQTAHEGIWVLDREGRTQYANERLAQLLGYPTETLVGQSVTGFCFPEDADGARERIARNLAGEREQFEFRFRRADGSALYVLASTSPMIDPDGSIQGALGLVTDITERRRLERRTREALDALLAMARSLVSPTPAATRVDEKPAARKAEQDAALRRLLELARGVLGAERVAFLAVDSVDSVDSVERGEQGAVGRLHAVAAVGYLPGLERQWRAAAEGALLRERVGDEAATRLLAGDIVTRLPPANPLGVESVLLSPVHSGTRLIGLLRIDNDLEGYAFSADEIALAGAVGSLLALVLERERLLAQAAEAHGRELALVETNRRMDEFLGIASHELRTPLTIMLAILQLARRRVERIRSDTREAGVAQVPADTLDAILALQERAERQTRRQDRLIADLLDTTRINTGRLEFRFARCDLGEVVREVVEDVRQLWPDRDVRVDLPDADRFPALVEADADRIGQVVTNYLTNALKYSPGDQPVDVTLTADGEQGDGDTRRFARVAVRDHGPGLPTEQQGRIWDRFHRAPGVKVLSGTGVGLGLGLYISREIIERHGGQVGVESATGRGATFWFTLPIASHA